MADTINLSVITPDGSAFKDSVSFISLPVENGSIGVLSNHAPLLTAIKAGQLRCRYDSGDTVLIEVSDGIADINHNTASVLVSTAKKAE